jgi:hypothetical protein
MKCGVHGNGKTKVKRSTLRLTTKALNLMGCDDKGTTTHGYKGLPSTFYLYYLGYVLYKWPIHLEIKDVQYENKLINGKEDNLVPYLNELS